MRRVAISTPLIAGIIIAVVVIGGAAIFLSGITNPTPSSSKSTSTSTPSTSPSTTVTSTSSASSASLPSSTTTQTSSTSSNNIVGGLVMVQAGGYQAYQFTVPGGTPSAHVVGNFAVQGGSGNILVIIVDPANFAKFQNSQPSTRIYDSGQVVTSSLNVSLPPGTYYLVFANKFDATNAKTVNAQVNLIYTA